MNGGVEGAQTMAGQHAAKNLHAAAAAAAVAAALPVVDSYTAQLAGDSQVGFCCWVGNQIRKVDGDECRKAPADLPPLACTDGCRWRWCLGLQHVSWDDRLPLWRMSPLPLTAAT